MYHSTAREVFIFVADVLDLIQNGMLGHVEVEDGWLDRQILRILSRSHARDVEPCPNIVMRIAGCGAV